MLPRMRIMLLAGLPCLLFSLGVDAAAQAGRLGGTVAYAAPGAYPVAARGVRVIAVGGYAQAETRTDNNGNFVLVLRAGEYSVAAQGAHGYVTHRESKGYVRAYTDSVITPNPIYLVPASRRLAGMTSPALSQTAVWSDRTKVAHQNGLTLDVAAQKGGTGRLDGRITILNGKVQEPARNFSVHAHGRYDSSETKTDSEGYFTTRAMRVGEYRIFVVEKDYQQQIEAVGTVTAGQTNTVSPNPIRMIRNKVATRHAKPLGPDVRPRSMVGVLFKNVPTLIHVAPRFMTAASESGHRSKGRGNGLIM